jgi:hypothetical protein
LTFSLKSLYVNPTVYAAHVNHENSLSFMRDRRTLNRKLREFSALSNVWSEILDDLHLIEKHIRYYPDADSSHAVFQTLIARALDSMEKHAGALPSEQQVLLSRISKNLMTVSRMEESPLKTKLAELVKTQGPGSNAIFIRFEKGRAQFEKVLQEIGGESWACVSYKQLKSIKVDSLIVIGSSASVGLQNQMQERLITSNYSKNIYFLDFPLYPDKKYFSGPLDNLAQVSLRINVNVPPKSQEAMTELYDFTEDNEEELELSARQFRSITMSKLSSLHLDPDEVNIRCMCFLLASGQAVFLPEAIGTVDVLNPTGAEGQRVSRKACSDIEPGDFLVLRVGSSDSEAIRAQADYLAGNQGLLLRRIQAEWKDRLKTAVSNKTLTAVENDLKHRGISRPWIKEWLKPGSIRPQSDDVFKILVHYLGMEVESTVSNMNALLALHKRAGFKFREALKEAFEEIDLTELISDSYLEMEIVDAAGVAKLGSYKCLSISSEIYDVPESAVKRVFEHSEGEFWDA